MHRLLITALFTSIVSTAAVGQSDAPRIVWRALGATDDFAITRDTTTAHEGRASVRFVAEDPPVSFAGILTQFPAFPYEGRRLRFSAQLRGAQLEGKGGVVWARADGANMAFSTSQETPVLGTTGWTPVEITLDVPRGATLIALGVYSNGKGTLWIDDVRLQADSVSTLHFGFEDPAEFVVPIRRVVARSPREAPRELNSRGLENVSTFAHLLSYVRFFHPAPEAVRVNWDEFAVRGVRAVEAAPSADSLAVTLRALFAPVAPSVVVYRTGSPAPPAPTAPSPGAGVVYWRHLGTGTPSGGVTQTNAQNIYSSTRVLVPGMAVRTPVALEGRTIGIGERPALVPDPEHPLQLALGAGLSVSLPVALYTMEMVPDSMRSAHPTAAVERITAADRATRLASVILMWGVMQHFYPYHEIAHTDWPAALRTSLTRAATDRDEAQFQETLDRMIAALHDGHGRVISTSSEYAVPDMRLGWVEGRIVVLAAGDSALAAGLRRGDVVLEVDGSSANERLAAMSERVSGASLQWVRQSALTRMLAGRPRTPVTLRVSSGASASREVRLLRANQVPARHVPDKIAELSPGIFYVDIDRITEADFNTALPRLAAAKGVVFDMRGYPQHVNTVAILAHLTDSTIHSARFEVPVVTLPDRVGMTFTEGGWTIQPASPRIKGRIAFLTGGGSISYAESTMGVVEGYRLAEIVGETTAGTNGNVNPFVLPGGYTVSWTGMRVTKQDGTPHHGVGILPTVPVSPTLAGIRAGRDEVLDRAVQLLGGRALVP